MIIHLGPLLLLAISNTVLADFGTYNCTVRNSYGEDFQLIDIVRKGES